MIELIIEHISKIKELMEKPPQSNKCAWEYIGRTLMKLLLLTSQSKTYFTNSSEKGKAFNLLFKLYHFLIKTQLREILRFQAKFFYIGTLINVLKDDTWSCFDNYSYILQIHHSERGNKINYPSLTILEILTVKDKMTQTKNSCWT